MRYLLDTHVLIWWVSDPKRLSTAQRRVLQRSERQPVLVSDVSLFEVAQLVERGRLKLGRPLAEWLREATLPPHVERVGITPEIAAETAVLPPTFHRDPIDRLLVATARVVGATLVTRDEAIIESGAVPTLG